VWTTARLRDIGEKAGIRQALVVADHLEMRKNPESWQTKPDPKPVWTRTVQRRYAEEVVEPQEAMKMPEVVTPQELGEWIGSNMEKSEAGSLQNPWSPNAGFPVEAEDGLNDDDANMDDYGMGTIDDEALFNIADMTGPQIGPGQFGDGFT
jgi:hypothetical protein